MFPVPQVQHQILEVAKNIPQERVRCIAEQTVDVSATVHCGIVEVIQLVPNATDHVNTIHPEPEIHEHFMIQKGYGTLCTISCTISTTRSAM